ALLAMVLPSLRPDPLLAAASARARPLPAIRVLAASNSGAQPPSSMDEDDHH
uniref:Uncharacterized protein n=1 Tax=Triticum urartu TaxID=4572 RepID=A0A8R7K4H8_TRIUA